MNLNTSSDGRVKGMFVGCLVLHSMLKCERKETLFPIVRWLVCNVSVLWEQCWSLLGSWCIQHLCQFYACETQWKKVTLTSNNQHRNVWAANQKVANQVDPKLVNMATGLRTVFLIIFIIVLQYYGICRGNKKEISNNSNNSQRRSG